MDLKVGQAYDVTVVKILGFGAIVALEDGSTELIHISNISDRYVVDVSDFVQVDHTYSALCVEGKVKPAELSLKHLSLKSNRPDSAECANPKSKRPAVHKSSKVAPKAATSLDDMIAASSREYEDKYGGNKRKRGRR